MNFLSKDQYKRLTKPKRHKYSAQTTRDLDGVECPSKLHARTSDVLIRKEQKGLIANRRREFAVRLKEKCTGCEHCSGCGARPLVYKVDFVYDVIKAHHADGYDYSVGEVIYVEPKGKKDDSFKRREREWKKTGPGRLELWFGRYRNGECVPYLAETVYPKGTE